MKKEIKIEEESVLDNIPVLIRVQQEIHDDATIKEASFLGSKKAERKKKKAVKDDNGGRKRRENVENLLALCRGKKLYYCKRCEFIGSKPCRLRKHIEEVHEKKMKFHCVECDYKAAQKGAVERHVAVVHKGKRNYKCPYCPYRAGQKMHLVKHSRVHVERKCEQCSFTARSRKEMKDHRADVHADLFHCPVCPYMTLKKRDMDTHVACVHEKRRDFVCGECDHRAGRKTDLRQHIIGKHLGGRKMGSQWRGKARTGQGKLHAGSASSELTGGTS